MFQAVTIFASNFDPIRAEEFYKDVLSLLKIIVFGSCGKN